MSEEDEMEVTLGHLLRCMALAGLNVFAATLLFKLMRVCGSLSEGEQIASMLGFIMIVIAVVFVCILNGFFGVRYVFLSGIAYGICGSLVYLYYKRKVDRAVQVK